MFIDFKVLNDYAELLTDACNELVKLEEAGTMLGTGWFVVYNNISLDCSLRDELLIGKNLNMELRKFGNTFRKDDPIFVGKFFVVLITNYTTRIITDCLYGKDPEQ